jgi:hypothetical protein
MVNGLPSPAAGQLAFSPSSSSRWWNRGCSSPLLLVSVVVDCPIPEQSDHFTVQMRIAKERLLFSLPALFGHGKSLRTRARGVWRPHSPTGCSFGRHGPPARALPIYEKEISSALFSSFDFDITFFFWFFHFLVNLGWGLRHCVYQSKRCNLDIITNHSSYLTTREPF